jgi:DNA-binding MarR family transcriptional regulator
MLDVDPFIDTVQDWIEVFMRRSMRDFIRFSRESGLSMSQIGALYHIHRRGSSAVSDLGEHLGITSAAASQMLERLVQHKLILRTEDPNDRRAKQIVLTEKGHHILQDGINARQSWLCELADNLSESEKEQIMISLKILTEKARYPELATGPNR